MFVVGIALGAVFGVIGSFMVTSSFRILDKGFSVENIIFLVISVVVFVLILRSIPEIIKKL